MVSLRERFVARPELPDNLIYISRRIVTEIVQEDLGREPKLAVGGGVDFSTPFGGVGLSLPEPTAPDYANLVELASRATTAVRSRTTRVDATGPRYANVGTEYLRIKMFLQMQDLSLGTWERKHDHPLAAFTGIEYLPGVGRLFLGLLGSAHNHLPEGSVALGRIAGRTPSDPLGMLKLIQGREELTGESLRTDHPIVRREASRPDLGSDAARFRAAVTLFRASALYSPSFLAEVLVQVHHRGRNVDLHLADRRHRGFPPFDHAILGAPVWIGLADPDDLSVDMARGRRRYQFAAIAPDAEHTQAERELYRRKFDGSSSPMTYGRTGRSYLQDTVTPGVLDVPPASRYDENWNLFDRWLAECIDRQAHRRLEVKLEDWPPKNVDVVRSLRLWFVEQAVRLAPEPVPFFSPQVSGRWWRRQWALAHDSTFGWLLCDPPTRSGGTRYSAPYTIVLTSGEAYPCSGDGVYVAPQGVDREQRARPLSEDPESNYRLARAILSEVVEWRRPLYMYGRSEVVVAADGVVDLVDGS